MFSTENKSHIPNNPLREDILNQVKEYISHAYADDLHLGDYITVEKTTLRVDFWSRNHGSEPKDSNCQYYDILSLIKNVDSAFTYIPDEIAIDIVVLDFFPIQKVDEFVTKAKSAINDFHHTHCIDNNTMLGISFSPLNIQAFNPNNLEEAVEDDYQKMIDELDDCSLIEEFELKPYIRLRYDGNLFINENKLKRLALELFNEY